MKEEEYLKYLNQLKISFQIDENQLNIQLNEQKNSLQNENLNQLIKEKENSLINHLNLQITHLQQMISSEKSLEFYFQNLHSNPTNLNENIHFIFNIYQKQFEQINRQFPSNEPDQIEEIFHEQFDEELNELNEFYQNEIRRTVTEHHQLENELILYEIRVRIEENVLQMYFDDLVQTNGRKMQ